VRAPGSAEPTALPPTPTPQPRAESTPNTQATVRAVLGDPERTLDGTTTAGSGGTPIASTEGTVPAQPGDVAGEIVSDASGQRFEVVQAAGGRLVRRPLNRTGVAGQQSGPDSAPVAGHGPGDPTTNAWYARTGGALMLMGAVAIAGGLGTRRKVTQETRE
jgi:hypothetical protein